MKCRWPLLLRLSLFLLLAGAFWPVVRAFAQSRNVVQILEPVDGQRFNPGATIKIEAAPGPGLAKLARMEFILSGATLAVISNAPYVYTWTNATPGTYILLARAVPESGVAAESAPVRIGVYDALLTFGLDRVKFLEQNSIFEIPLWQYCASLIYIFLAFYIAKFLDYLARGWLKRRTSGGEHAFDTLLVDLLKGPIKIVLFVGFLRVGLELFSWPATVHPLLFKAFTVIVAASLTYMSVKFIDLALGYWKHRARPDADRSFEEQLFPILRKTFKVFAIVVATLLTLDNIGVNITAAIASLSIGGLAVGLAAQDTLANIFGAVAIFVDKPFRIGDEIKLDSSTEGIVESIGLRSTRVRNPDGFLIAVPNKTMGAGSITNRSRRQNIQTEMNFGLAFDTPAEKVREALKIIQDVYRSNPGTLDLLVGFNKYTPSGLNLWAMHTWKGTDYPAYLAGIQEMHLKLKERLDAANIRLALPAQTIHLDRREEKDETRRG